MKLRRAIRRRAVYACWRHAWAAPVTFVGLALALTALYRGRLRMVGGVVEAHGPFLRWALRRLIPIPGGAAAITLGHVVLGVNDEALSDTRRHERVHVRQYERWGALFPLLYVLASLWARLRGGDAYRDNHFERAARASEPEGTGRVLSGREATRASRRCGSDKRSGAGTT